MRWFLILGLLCGPICAQQHNLTVGAGVLAPVSGWKTSGFEPGPAINAAYGLRFHRHLQAEVGYTRAWPTYHSCGKYDCDDTRQLISLLDYGLRVILPLKQDRVELSAGFGGGNIWLPLYFWRESGALIQYSARAGFALDARRRYRLDTTVRFWRDLGRPTQQWVTATAGFTLGLGR